MNKEYKERMVDMTNNLFHVRENNMRSFISVLMAEMVGLDDINVEFAGNDVIIYLEGETRIIPIRVKNLTSDHYFVASKTCRELINEINTRKMAVIK